MSDENVFLKMPQATMDIVREFARRRGTDVSSLLEFWLDEKLREEALKFLADFNKGSTGPCRHGAIQGSISPDPNTNVCLLCGEKNVIPR